MTQARLVVYREIVDRLIYEFLYRGKSACTSFRPREMDAAFRALPDEGGWVDYGKAVRVLDGFRCHKLTGQCDSWTGWIRQRLNDFKRPRP